MEAAEEAAVASALNQLFDQPRDPSAPPGMLGATTVKTETGPVKVAAFSPEALARAGGVARVGSGRNGEAQDLQRLPLLFFFETSSS